MVEKKYYYLIASLPDLHFGQSFPYMDVPVTMRYIFEEIEEKDVQKAKYLFLFYDHKNLINLCLHKKEAWHPLSLFKRETLIRCVSESSSEIPSYLYEFYDDFLKGKLPEEEYKLEHVLTTAYFDFVLPKTDGVLFDWLSFTRDFNNILVALSARQNRFSTDYQIIGDNSVVNKLKTNSNRDFGLQSDFPFIEHVVHLSEQNNLLELEKQIDFIRWNKIDEYVLSSQFTFDKILAFIIKLLIAYRWINLEKSSGGSVIDDKVSELITSIRFSKEFNI